jgi:hypothetical protein
MRINTQAEINLLRLTATALVQKAAARAERGQVLYNYGSRLNECGYLAGVVQW